MESFKIFFLVNTLTKPIFEAYRPLALVPFILPSLSGHGILLAEFEHIFFSKTQPG